MIAKVTTLKEGTAVDGYTDDHYKVEVIVTARNLKEVVDAITATKHTPYYYIVDRP